jgi:hypothetical protein
LTDDEGTPLNSSVDMLIKLYDGGTAVHTLHSGSVNVVDGRFEVDLGSNTMQFEKFDRQYDIGIKIGTDPEIAPRTPLKSVPYALGVRGFYAYDPNTLNEYSFNVVAGYGNSVEDQVYAATIGGGGFYDAGTTELHPNVVNGDGGTISGGYDNTAGLRAVVGGGRDNTASGLGTTIGGGSENEAKGFYATVPGGYHNVAAAGYTFAAGRSAEALHSGAFVWADSLGGWSNKFQSTGINQFLIRASGGVGIGTNAPAGQLHISGGDGDVDLILEADEDNVNETDNPLMHFLQDGGDNGMRVGFDETGFGANRFGIGRRWGNVDHFDTFVIEAGDGDVGIGTNTPGSNRLRVNNSTTGGITTATLDVENFGTGDAVAGHFESNGVGAALIVDQDGTGDHIRTFDNGVLRFAVRDNGNVNADGTFTSPASDLAEWFQVEGGAGIYEPGDVMVISDDFDLKLAKSDTPYSTRVAGVYATKPGVLLGEAVDGETIPVGVVGVLPTKVSGENGPIRRGDLLVSSSTAGHAMRAEPRIVDDVPIYPTGSIIGKALESFEGKGQGFIRVLVMPR